MLQLNAIILIIAHDDAPTTVDGNAVEWTVELSKTATSAADGAGVSAMGLIQHLQSMIALFKLNQMTGAIQRDTVRNAEMAIAVGQLRRASSKRRAVRRAWWTTPRL